MKQNETLSNIHLKDGKIILTDEEIDTAGDNHISTSVETPMRAGAFDQTEDEKIAAIQQKFAEIMDILGLDLTDDSLRGTPKRVAKMYVKEIFMAWIRLINRTWHSLKINISTMKCS